MYESEMPYGHKTPDWIKPADAGYHRKVQYHADYKTVSKVVYTNREYHLHRTGGPARQIWTAQGALKGEEWFHEGCYHRVGGPASTRFWPNGNLGEYKWYNQNKIHRTDGPAWETWHENGQPHTKEWYQNNELHRMDGPASIVYDLDGKIIREEWYLKGIEQDRSKKRVGHS